MHTKLLVFLLALLTSPLFAQEEQPPTQQQNWTERQPQEQTLFRRDRLRGGFGGPIFTYNFSGDRSGYGAGGGGGLVFDRAFVGLFGMGDLFDVPQIGHNQLALGYGGLWLGYVYPSHKVIHLYTSAKIGGGSVGYTDFDDNWGFHDNWNDAVLVMSPEAGFELNLTRWFRLSGSVGYRWVNGFAGNSLISKNDLNAPYTALTLRFGWFSKGRKAKEQQ